MTDTIKDYFRHRSRRAWTVTGIGYAIFVPVSILAWLGGESGRYGNMMAAMSVAGITLVFGGMLYLDRTRCPKCRKRLGFGEVNPHRLRGAPLAQCPGCAVNFNDPWP